MWKSRASLAGLLVVLVAPACAERPAAPDTATGAGTQSAAAVVAGALKFIENDAPLALVEAKRRGVPIFVEAWAPW